MIDPVEIEKIKQLKYRYLRALDTGDVDGLRACIAEDATALFIGNRRTEIKGRDEIVKIIMGHANG